MDLMTLAMELIVGRLVLDLPKKDLKKVNEMIKKNLERWKMFELIIAIGLTAFIISYLIYWYFFEERPDQIRM